ncbi:ATP-dependent RNA helicase DDX27, putative [Plasmodium ovale]|uniref:ATP-dependent RNA helicase n=1 Tax=Plasmodium ovale TaxID=36330 RepID=A0A1D3U907_PLAOA|nr:ATP-dependent RNA helicase DDX27, putative [Plasmodium ovale]
MFFTPFLISYFLFIVVNSYNINKVRNNIFPYARCIYQNVITTEGKRVVLKSTQKYNTFTIEHFPSKTETGRNKDGFFFKSDKTFSQFHIHSFLVEQLKKNNIHVPSVIQSDLLEYYNNNFEKLKNIIIAAENGIGKTLSYIIFILNHILKQPKMKSTFVLIFQYNNLLSKQCYDIVKSLSRSVKVKTTNLKKGDLLNLSSSVILISSPVRFVTYMKENKEVVENFLNHLNFFIIDEVDVMFDKPYMKYISIVYEEIHKRNTGNIISLITSSTLCNKGKKSIYNNIMKYIKNAVIIKTDFFHNIHPFINYHFINLKIYNIKTKIDTIKNIILNEDHKKVLIFCNTVKSCNTICSLLKCHFDNIFSFNSSLKKVDQFEILELFKNSENPILVTTDIIHRGIDIKNITHLFHFDAPSNIIVYTHRNGRISRGASTGDIYMFNHSESLITKKIYELHKNNVKFEDIFSRKRSLRKNFKRDIKKSNQQKNIA